jgi:hypothetical protein
VKRYVTFLVLMAVVATLGAACASHRTTPVASQPPPPVVTQPPPPVVTQPPPPVVAQPAAPAPNPPAVVISSPSPVVVMPQTPVATTPSGTLVDRNSRWRGVTAAGSAGTVVGGTVTDVRARAAREAASTNQAIAYQTEDNFQRVEAYPLAVAAPSGCRRIEERIYQNGQLLQDTMWDVCGGVAQAPAATVAPSATNCLPATAVGPGGRVYTSGTSATGQASISGTSPYSSPSSGVTGTFGSGSQPGTETAKKDC